MLQNLNKDDLYLRFKQINEKLTVRNIQLIQDEEVSPEPVVLFNNCFTHESFEYELYNDIDELQEAIMDFEFHELDKVKVQSLRNHFADRLQASFMHPVNISAYNQLIEQCSPEQKQEAEAFVQKQAEIKQYLIDQLLSAAPQKSQMPKVKWNGNLLQFAELLLELEEKEWVKVKSTLSMVKAISSGFDFSDAQDVPDHDTAVKTIYRNMHADEVERFGKTKLVFSKLYNEGYIPMFGGILSKNFDNQ